MLSTSISPKRTRRQLFTSQNDEFSDVSCMLSCPKKARVLAWSGVAGFTQNPLVTDQTTRLGHRKKAELKMSQALLAVKRRCRDCGVYLGAVESALHCCTVALRWSFPIEEVCVREGESINTESGRSVRISRLCFSTPSIQKRFEELWDFVQSEMSHSLVRPSVGDVASGTHIVLLALQSREVVGLVVAKYLDMSTPVDIFRHRDEAPATRLSSGNKLGIMLVWVRAAERRKGIARGLMNAIRRVGAGLGAPPLPLSAVAFSQPTTMGFVFASHYVGNGCEGVPVYREE